jgi:hypothetical protein
VEESAGEVVGAEAKLAVMPRWGMR